MSMIQAKQFTLAAADPSSRGIAIEPGSTFEGMSHCLGLWRQRIRSRRQMRRLCGLDNRTLRDIGLIRGRLYLEGCKPFWRP
jgi:uncharacterized protein YjiS (DUF1127 family)